MAEIDIFNPVSVDFTINEPTSTPLAVNNVALMSTNTTAIPLGTLVKRYASIDDVTADFGTTDPEYQFASQFFATNNGYSYLLIASFDDTAPSAGYLQAAVEAAYNKSIELGYGPFSGLGWASTSFVTDTATTISELDALATWLADEKTTMQTMAIIDNEDVFNLAVNNVLEEIANQKYKGSLFVGLHGVPDFSTDPNPFNKRTDAASLGILSTASLETLGSMALYGQNFPGISAIPVNQTDSNYGIVFSKSKVNQLVNAQLNLYSQLGQKVTFAFGTNAIVGEFIDYITVYIKLFVTQYLERQLDVYFTPSSLKYDATGISTVHGQINVDLKNLAAQNIIETKYTIEDPVLDPTATTPRTLGPFKVDISVGGIVYAISVAGNLNVT